MKTQGFDNPSPIQTRTQFQNAVAPFGTVYTVPELPTPTHAGSGDKARPSEPS